MRITGGKARGIPLKAPKGDGTRPATDRMREAVFSSLGLSIEGCSVADLFAGTGSYGLEALSRGADNATFFETGRDALTCLRRNIQSVIRSCNLDTSCARVIARDVFSLDANGSRYDIIFLDPSYSIIEAKLDQIFQIAVNNIATETARAILELPGNVEPSIQGWEITRRIGKAGKDKPTIAILHRAAKA